VSGVGAGSGWAAVALRGIVAAPGGQGLRTGSGPAITCRALVLNHAGRSWHGRSASGKGLRTGSGQADTVTGIDTGSGRTVIVPGGRSLVAVPAVKGFALGQARRTPLQGIDAGSGRAAVALRCVAWSQRQRSRASRRIRSNGHRAGCGCWATVPGVGAESRRAGVA